MVCNKPFTIGEGLICFQACLKRSHKARCDKKKGTLMNPLMESIYSTK
jgi:hypothetical protein